MKVINNKYSDLNSIKKDFINKAPFPHIVLDDFLDNNYFNSLDKVLKKNNYYNSGKNFNSEVELNKSISINQSLPKVISNIVDELNSNNWINCLKSLTGIDSLKATKTGNTELANYHEMGTSGFLGSHVDHSSEPTTGKPHVLNIILYLSSDWKDEFGGATLFFDKYGKKVISKVSYKKNRAVIFLHTPYSFHGVEKLKNNNVKRKVIYVDYYSDSFKPYKHLKFNYSNDWFSHGTTFILKNKMDYFKRKNWSYAKSLIKYKLNLIKSKFNN